MVPSDSKNVPNMIQTALKWQFFPKNYKIHLTAGGPAPNPRLWYACQLPHTSKFERFHEQINFSFGFKPHFRKVLVARWATQGYALLAKDQSINQSINQLTGRSTGFFLQKVSIHFSIHLMKTFQKGGGTGEVLKFATSERNSQKKKCQKFLPFLQT